VLYPLEFDQLSSLPSREANFRFVRESRSKFSMSRHTEVSTRTESFSFQSSLNKRVSRSLESSRSGLPGEQCRSPLLLFSVRVLIFFSLSRWSGLSTMANCMVLGSDPWFENWMQHCLFVRHLPCKSEKCFESKLAFRKCQVLLD